MRRNIKVLVLGSSGMLGSAVFLRLLRDPAYEVLGTVRDIPIGMEQHKERLMTGVNVLDQDALVGCFSKAQPDVVVNCVGLIKQLDSAADPLTCLPLNSLLPHRIAQLCDLGDARLIHISTDCVFSGSEGMYRETDPSDAKDMYGISKHIGEVTNRLNAITLRTSIIGHEMGSSRSLLEWFLAQHGEVKGYRKAVFSGLPTCELAEVIATYVIPNNGMHGLFHVSSDPINKYDLLKLIAAKYEKKIKIIPHDDIEIDRSMDSSLFRDATGYSPASWQELVNKMKQHNQRV